MPGKNRLLIGAILAPMLIVACSDGDGLFITETGNDTGTVGSHTPHTGVAEGIWPPQPANMENAEAFPASARQGVLSGVLDAARRSIMNNPQVRSGLGSDYREIEATLGDEKSDQIAGIVFYNYATDETIDVSLDRTGAVTSEVFPASAYQPMEHPDEQADAIALAQTALTNSSFDVTGLQPTAMLAFPPRSDMQSDDQQFYQQRVMYVTFGVGGGELPVYTALVDLSSANVIEHGLVK